MDIAGLAAQMASLQWHLPLTTAARRSHLQGAIAPFVGSLWRETWPCTKPLPCCASNGLPTMNRIVIAQVSPVRGVANPKPRKGCHVRGATSFWRPTSGRGGNTIRACAQTTSMSWMCQRTGGNGMMRGGASIWHWQSRKNLLQAQGLAGLRQGQGKSAAKLVVKKRVAAADLVVKNQNRDVAAADLVENIVQGVRRAGSAVWRDAVTPGAPPRLQPTTTIHWVGGAQDLAVVVSVVVVGLLLVDLEWPISWFTSEKRCDLNATTSEWVAGCTGWVSLLLLPLRCRTFYQQYTVTRFLATIFVSKHRGEQKSLHIGMNFFQTLPCPIAAAKKFVASPVQVSIASISQWLVQFYGFSNAIFLGWCRPPKLMKVTIGPSLQLNMIIHPKWVSSSGWCSFMALGMYFFLADTGPNFFNPGCHWTTPSSKHDYSLTLDACCCYFRTLFPQDHAGSFWNLQSIDSSRKSRGFLMISIIVWTQNWIIHEQGSICNPDVTSGIDWGEKNFIDSSSCCLSCQAPFCEYNTFPSGFLARCYGTSCCVTRRIRGGKLAPYIIIYLWYITLIYL